MRCPEYGAKKLGERMNNLCDLCLRDPSQCENQIEPCNYIPKYNLCPICKEKIEVFEPKCRKCGYDFNIGSEDKE
jgi:hypothetical protein